MNLSNIERDNNVEKDIEENDKIVSDCHKCKNKFRNLNEMN